MSVTDFLQFVSESPTAFHAVDAASKRLEQHGFSRLFEGQSWDLSAGQGYFVTRNQSSLIAFRIPEHWTHFQITASHSDSPMFKLKPRPVSPSGQAYVRLNVEKYGGAILSTWLDRPLSVAGRVLAETENGIQSHLIRLDDLSLIIPNLPIHFNREVNSGYNFNVQQDLLPVLGDEADETALTASICEAAGIQASQLLGTDLFLYNREAGCLWGARKQFFSSPRIDDLECAYTSLVSFLSSKPDGFVPVYALFDNEEVGSQSGHGAGSTLLPDVLTRLCTRNAQGLQEILTSSIMLSCDNAHAVHPNHPEKYDEQNRTFMNRGIVLKTNAAQKYTTTGVSMALFESLCRKAAVPCQYFANRSDIPGGSTLGNIANSQISMCTADIGLAQLAMHSAYESAGCLDLDYMISALSQFYSCNLIRTADGQWTIE